MKAPLQLTKRPLLLLLLIRTLCDNYHADCFQVDDGIFLRMQVRKKCEIVFCFINEMANSVQHLRSMWMWKFRSRLRKNPKAAECNEIAEFLRGWRRH